jgi:OTU domain-containing protein 3
MGKNKKIYNNKYRTKKPNFEKNSKKRDKEDPASESEFKDHFSAFDAHLKKIGLGLKDIDGDGNCLFRAISDQMEGSQENYKFYRALTCKYIEDNGEFFKLFISDDITIEKYLKLIGKDGVWGGNLELQALSKALKINFVVHMLNRPALIIVNDHENIKNEKPKTIHLAFHYGENIGEHYSSVRNLNDLESKGPAQPIIFKEEFFVGQTEEEKNEMENMETIIKKTEKLKIQENMNEGYPRNKKCFCGSKTAYKNCCLVAKKTATENPKNIVLI